MILSKEEKDEAVVSYLDGLLAQGKRRGEAIAATCQKFSILHPQTVYNTEVRVRRRLWDKEHGHGEQEA